MTRTLFVCALLTAWPSVSQAQATSEPAETVISLTVQPMAAPKPALRYLLLPELKELNPGNPIHGYLKCFMEQQNFFFNKEAVDRRDKMLTMPLKELPAKELQDYGGFALRQADWAARLDKPDWQILLKTKTEGLNLLLPDVQQMRALASALKVRFRAEAALGRYDDALRTAKTMFALSRHMGEHPTLIGDLVGIAIATITIGPLEEMLQQPGCPNLYWALTNLPNPLISVATGMEGERVLVRGEFHDLDDSAPMSEEQLQKLIVHIDKVREVAKGEQKKPGEPDQSTRAWLDARNNDEALVAAARRRLVEYGLPEERLARFPVDQVLLLDEWREFEVRRDEAMKLMNLPTWQAQETLERMTKTGPSSDVASPGEALFTGLVPALYKVRLAQGRLEQRIALLRAVEALRLYAAEHDGKLPAKLSDVPVPLPPDPFTGKPFRYELDGTTGHLRGSPPAGQEKIPAYNVHYEVTIQK
jgi:hypothetical protein